MRIPYSAARFGAYSVETYKRRNKQRFTNALIGHQPLEVFDRMRRNLVSGAAPWGNFIPSADFLYLLEQTIGNADKEKLQELDKALEQFDGLIPEQVAKALESRAMHLLKKSYEGNTPTAKSNNLTWAEWVSAVAGEIQALKYEASPDPDLKK